MVTYIICGFSILLFVFLTGLTIQVIGIEKAINDASRLVEIKVKKLFQTTNSE